MEDEAKVNSNSFTLFHYVLMLFQDAKKTASAIKAAKSQGKQLENVES